MRPGQAPTSFEAGRWWGFAPIWSCPVRVDSELRAVLDGNRSATAVRHRLEVPLSPSLVKDGPSWAEGVPGRRLTEARGEDSVHLSSRSRTDSTVFLEADILGFVGRKSRLKKERREDPVLQRMRVGMKAEKRGRRIQPQADAYEQVASARGTSGVIEGLLSRHNQRWENVAHQSSELTECIVETLHISFPLDVALWKLGVRFDLNPSHPSSDWPDHLNWALDSAAQCVRMTLACNPVGAAAVARTQLERWSVNRVVSNSIDRAARETTADFYTRIWSPETAPYGQYDPSMLPAAPVGDVWAELSEVLHGRGPLVDAARWETVDLADPTMGSGMALSASCQSAEQLALQQVALCVVDACRRAGIFSDDMGRALMRLPPRLPSEIYVRAASPMLAWPLTYEGLMQFGHALESCRGPYLDDVSGLAQRKPYRSRSYSERSLDAFAARRGNAARTARIAFEQELSQLGEHFAPESVSFREFSYILINETAGLLSRWGTGPQSDALAVGASALRAGLWLWLEDDDRSLVAARTVLEQAARLRTWRLKPDRASTIEEQGPRTSARDWLEAAGWRRLRVINRSLGEFSHIPDQAQESWHEARKALTELQDDLEDDGPSRPEQTTRGATLNKIAFAFGSEVRALALKEHQVLGSALGEVLPEADLARDEIERWMRRCWEFRPST